MFVYCVGYIILLNKTNARCIMYYKYNECSIVGEFYTLSISILLKLKCGDAIKARFFNTVINYRFYISLVHFIM